jgi:porphobilinogen synthase
MSFPVQRMRRLRKHETIRQMVREHRISLENLIYPVFLVNGHGIRNEIPTLRGNYHLSVDMICSEVQELKNSGIRAILIFGIPKKKDVYATEAYASDGIVQQAVREVKSRFPEIAVITDVCLCEYTEHGHCGIVEKNYLLNDVSVELIAKTAVSHAEAGADIVAPAAMLDGQIRGMRSALDTSGFIDTPIMAYAAKYASKLYDLFFKYGTGGVLAFGDKKSHQMDYANSNEALREIALDIEEGADIIMIKPALMYLDIVYRAKQEFKMPLAVYNVSGEFAMVEEVTKNNLIDNNALKMEIMTAFRRAGADLIITYHAKEIARQLNQELQH